MVSCFASADLSLMQQHLSLINKKVNTVKDIPAKEFIEVFANHLKKINKFKIPDVSCPSSHR